MTALGWIVTAGTIWFCFQFAAVLVCWRFTQIRPTFEAVLRERIAQPGFGDDVWSGLDRAMAEPWDEPDCLADVFAVEDDIDTLVDAINEDREKALFAAWENEFGERAS